MMFDSIMPAGIGSIEMWLAIIVFGGVVSFGFYFTKLIHRKRAREEREKQSLLCRRKERALRIRADQARLMKEKEDHDQILLKLKSLPPLPAYPPTLSASKKVSVAPPMAYKSPGYVQSVKVNYPIKPPVATRISIAEVKAEVDRLRKQRSDRQRHAALSNQRKDQENPNKDGYSNLDPSEEDKNGSSGGGSSGGGGSSDSW